MNNTDEQPFPPSPFRNLEEPKGRALDYALAELRGDRIIQKGEEDHLSWAGWWLSPDGARTSTIDDGPKFYSSSRADCMDLLLWFLWNGDISQKPGEGRGLNLIMDGGILEVEVYDGQEYGYYAASHQPEEVAFSIARSIWRVLTAQKEANKP